MLSTRYLQRVHCFGIWCGPLYVITAVISWGLLAGFLPPWPPGWSAEQVAAVFATDTTRIRIGMVALMFSAAALIPFAGAIARRVSHLERGPGVLTYCTLIGTMGTIILTFYPAIWWLWAAYRPERAPELIMLINDLAWLQFVGGLSMYFGLPVAVTILAFGDRSARPAFPRWCGYFNLWVMLLIIPDQLLFFFHDGPFAWNGVFALWIPLIMFGIWFFVTTYVLHKAEQHDPLIKD